MNRPKEYDREKVLAKITDLFWEKGFVATSMSEVVARTKVNSFSIYNEFGDKEKLFLASIDYYIHNTCNFVEEILEKEPLGLTNIEEFFEYKVNHSALLEHKGCLIFNSIIENESLSNRSNQKVNSFISKIKTLFRKNLNAAQARKEISTNKDSEASANYLSCFLFGLVNLGMKGMSEKELREVTDLALSTVKD